MRYLNVVRRRRGSAGQGFLLWAVGVITATSLIYMGAWLNERHGLLRQTETGTLSKNAERIKEYGSLAHQREAGEQESANAGEPSSLQAFKPSISPDFLVAAVEKVAPAVVSIETYQKGQTEFFRFFHQSLPEGEDRPSGVGSGVVFDSSRGYIVTNAHVIKDVDRFAVRLKDGRLFEDTKVVGSDGFSDIAVISVKARDLPEAKFGSSEKLKVGSWVIAIGAPLQHENTVTVGIVSAKGRAIGDPEGSPYLDDLIQTDAAINQGNSGGPLCNVKGEVIGINTAIQRVGPAEEHFRLDLAEGIGFAIAIDSAKPVIQQLILHGKVQRPWLGVGYDMLSEKQRQKMRLPEAKGLLIREVRSDSPAEKGGLQKQDVIVAIGGKAVQDISDLKRAVKKAGVGKKVRLKVFRKGRYQELTVTVGAMPVGRGG